MHSFLPEQSRSESNAFCSQLWDLHVENELDSKKTDKGCFSFSFLLELAASCDKGIALVLHQSDLHDDHHFSTGQLHDRLSLIIMLWYEISFPQVKVSLQNFIHRDSCFVHDLVPRAGAGS